MVYMDYMDPDVLCLKKADKLNHLLTHCTGEINDITAMKQITELRYTIWKHINITVHNWSTGNEFFTLTINNVYMADDTLETTPFLEIGLWIPLKYPTFNSILTLQY